MWGSEFGDGRWEMGDGRWEMGDGRWEMGDGRWESEIECLALSSQFLVREMDRVGGCSKRREL
jgi:hypothetical protein